MTDEKNKQNFIFVIIFGIFMMMGSANTFASEIDPTAIKNKLETNTEIKGKKFQVGMMGNYYKVCLHGNPAWVYEDIKILQCSNTQRISTLGENGLQRTKTILANNVVGFSVNLPRGYGFTLLYGMNLTDDSKTNETFRETTDLTIQLLSSTLDTIFLTEVEASSTYYSSIDRSKNKATLYLVGDVIKVNLTVKQYQSWWWGDQPLYSEEVTAYVICNLHDYVEYSD